MYSAVHLYSQARRLQFIVHCPWWLNDQIPVTLAVSMTKSIPLNNRREHELIGCAICNQPPAATLRPRNVLLFLEIVFLFPPALIITEPLRRTPQWGAQVCQCTGRFGPHLPHARSQLPCPSVGIRDSLTLLALCEVRIARVTMTCDISLLISPCHR